MFIFLFIQAFQALVRCFNIRYKPDPGFPMHAMLKRLNNPTVNNVTPK